MGWEYINRKGVLVTNQKIMQKAFKAIKHELEMTYLSLKTKESEPEAHSDDIKDSDVYPRGTMLGRAPRWAREWTTLPTNTKRINRYLQYQEYKLHDLITRKKNYNKAATIWCILLKNSKSYQLVLFNRVKPDWYWSMTTLQAIKLLKSFSNKCRRWDLKLTLERFYIIKNKVDSNRHGIRYSGELLEGEKLRPIGSPTLESRMMSKALNDMTYSILEARQKKFQHGYRKGKGTHTALIEIAGMMRSGIKTFYEFDFKSFFNRIKLYHLNIALSMKCGKLATVIMQVILKIQYKYKGLMEEQELEKLGLGRLYEYDPQKNILVKGASLKPAIKRRGVPQGLNISPLLATMLLEEGDSPKNLVMYADDGVIGLSEGEEHDEWFQRLEHYGIELEPKKSGTRNSKFKFLGVVIDLTEQTMSYNQSEISIHDKKFNEWVKTVTNKYGKESKDWTWKVNNKSMVMEHLAHLQWTEKFPIIVKGILDQFGKKTETHKGYKFIVGTGIVDINGSSSICISRIASVLASSKLARIKPLKMRDRIKNWDYALPKRNYVEKLINPPFSEYEDNYRGKFGIDT